MAEYSMKHHRQAEADVTIYYQPSSCNCAGKTTYSADAIHAACAEALLLASEGEQVGRDNYPHAYNDNEHFSFTHAQAPYFEFPIMPSGAIFDGSTSPGADRIVIGSVAADYSSAVYCATLTHTGSAHRNGFEECKDQTVKNVPGEEERQKRQVLQPGDVKIPWHVPAAL